MADLDFTAGVKSDGSDAQLAASISASLTKAFNKLGPQLSKMLAKDFANIFSGGKANDIFEGAIKGAKAFDREIQTVSDRLDALYSGGRGQRKAFPGLDPRSLDAVESSLEQIIRLQADIAKGGGSGGKSGGKDGILARAAQAELTAVRVLAQQATLAIREANNASARDTNQVSRERTAVLRAENGRAVAELQTRSAREVALLRTSAQQQIATTQATAKSRAATFALVATAVRSSERVIRSTFENTARVVSASLNGITRTASSVASGLGNAFRSANRSVVNNFNASNSQINSSYSKGFSRNTSIVNSELGKQETRVRQFSREATEEISSIGLGRVGAFAAIGVLAGKALTGGFNRATTLETAELGLTKLLGSAEKAKELLAEVTNVVTGTPFALDQFAAATSTLIAYNVEAEKIPAILRAAGDAAALAGPNAGQAIDSILRSIGQIKTVGRASLEEIKVIAEAGVPAFKILGNTLGVTTEELRDMFEKGLVPADAAIDALISGITNGTDGINGATAAFGGLAKSLGGTLAGSVSNLRTSLNRLGAGVITAFKEPFTQAAGAATAAIDLLGAALKSVAIALQNSAGFRLLQRGLVGVTSAFKSAKTELAPFFEFISEGIVIVGQFAAALFVFKRIPALLGAVAAAFKVVLSPTNLLIGAAILVASYFKDIYDESQDLRTALSEIGATIARIATVIKDLAVDAFAAFSGGAKAAGDGIGSLGSSVLDVVLPALERLSGFLLQSVLPRIRDFAKFVRTDVLPFVGDALARAAETGRNALAGFAKFATAAFNILVKGGTTLSADGFLAYDGPLVKGLFAIRRAFKSLYGFLADTLVPFIQSNLTPVLAGLGAAFAALTFSGGNLPLAGLVGVGAGVVAALTNDDIRGRLIKFFGDVVSTIQAQFKKLFDSGTIGAIGVGVLKVARKIGQVLANALTDRRLVTVVAAVAGAAVAVAAAFVLGLGEGIVGNLPDLAQLIADGLGAALSAAFGALTSDPKLAAAVVGALFGAAAIARLVLAGRNAGKVLTQALTEGAVTAGGQGAGGGRSGLLNGLFGGPAAIQQSAALAGQKYGQTLTRAIQNEVRLISKLGGNLPTEPLGLGRRAGESFVDQNKRLAGTFQELTGETRRLEGNLGKAAVAGVRLGEGLGQVASGGIRQGFAQLGTAVQSAGRQIGAAAGTLAGGAFAASFVAQALFDTESSGKQKLQSALGTIAVGAATGAELGGPKGAAIGAGAGLLVTAVGLLTTKVNESKEAFKRATTVAESYKSALDGIVLSAQTFDLVGRSSATTDALIGQFQDNLREVPEIVASLDKAGFSIDQLQDKLTGKETGGNFFAIIENQLRDAGIEGEEFDKTIDFIKDQLAGYRIALDAEAGLQNIFASAEADADLATGAAKVASDATQAFNDKVTELNNARIDGLKSRVDEAKGALDEAGGAADAAKEKLRQFLSGETVTSTLDQQINDTIIGVANIASGLDGLDLNLVKDQASFNNQIAEVQRQVGGILTEAQPATPEALAGLIAPLRTAIEQEDLSPDITAALQGGIDAAVAAFEGQEGKDLLTGLFDAEALKTELETALSGAEINLAEGIKIDPLDLALIAETARAAFVTAGAESSAGYVEGFDSEAMATAAGDAAKAALEAAETALGISSPSTVFAAMGKFSGQGYAQGINGSKGLMYSASFQAGLFAMQGFKQGIITGGNQVVAAARSIARQAIEALNVELVIDSPSKVTTEIGEYFGEGLAEGIEATGSSVLHEAVQLAVIATRGLTSAGRQAAKAIGRGFAEEGASFAGSVRGALDDALEEAEYKVDQFKSIGKAIGSALFGQLPGSIGGGPGDADLQRGFLDILGNAGGLQDFITAQTQEVIGTRKGRDGKDEDILAGFYGLSFDAANTTGRENQGAFLDAGQDVRDYIALLIEGGRTVESAVGEGRVYRDQLIAIAQAAGASAGTIDGLVRSLGLADDQLNGFVASVHSTTAAVTAATTAENARIQAELIAEQQREAAEKFREESEKRAREAEEEAEKRERQREDDERKRADEARAAEERMRREYTLAGPTFRDLIIQSPSGDPEAVALAAANRVAFAIRR